MKSKDQHWLAASGWAKGCGALVTQVGKHLAKAPTRFPFSQILQLCFDLAVIEKNAGMLKRIDERLVVVVEIALAPIRRIEIHAHYQRFPVAFVQAIAQHAG